MNYIIRPRQVVSRFLVSARTKSVKSENWPLFVLRMRSQFLRPFSRIINENLRIMHVFLRLQPWILDFAKILQTRATSGSAGTWFSHVDMRRAIESHVPKSRVQHFRLSLSFARSSQSPVLFVERAKLTRNRSWSVVQACQHISMLFYLVVIKTCVVISLLNWNDE